MSKKYPGGFISKTLVPPTRTSASGIWTLDQALLINSGNWPIYREPVNYYTFQLPSGGSIWGTLQTVSGTLTESFSVSPSNSGGSITTSSLSGLSGGNWDLTKLDSNWIDYGSKYWWWGGNAGSWTQDGSMSFGCFMVAVGSVTSSACIISNWVNNIERWYSGFPSSSSIYVYGASAGSSFSLTTNRIYWINVTYNGSTVNLYVDGSLVSTQTGRYGSASGYLSLANYYSVGSYTPGTGVLYINNMKIYTGSSSTFSPQ